jgi:hypothetical protein
VAGGDDAVRATERWFVGRGLPHFIFHYSASRDVWTRAAPLLAFVAVIEVIANAPSSDFEWWVSVLVSLAAFAALLAVWGISNRLRGRPTFARPDDVGPVEVALFVIVPAVVPIASGGQWRSGLVTAGINIGLLVLIYVGTSYGIVPMTRWAIAHSARQILTVSAILVRALPLLLLIVIVVFATVEPWQIADDLRWPVLLLASVVLFATGVLFAVIRIPKQVGELSRIESWTGVRDQIGSSPALALCDELPADPPPAPRLSRKEWGNVGLVVLVSEAVLVATVVAGMFVFLVALGTLTIPPGVIRSWIGHAPDTLVSFSLFSERLVVTTQLLKVSGFLAAFSGLQFTVSLLSEGQYRA